MLLIRYFSFLRDGMDEIPEELGLKAGNYPESEANSWNFFLPMRAGNSLKIFWKMRQTALLLEKQN